MKNHSASPELDQGSVVPAHSAPRYVHDGAPFVILRMPEVVKKTGRSRSSIYGLMNRKSRFYDPSFPRPIRLSLHGSSVGWLAAEVDEWLMSRVLATRSAEGGLKN